MKTLTRILFLTAFCFTLNACSYNNGYYSAISDRPITLYSLTTKKKWRVAENVESKSANHTWLFLTLEDIPTIEYAIGKVLDEYMGDYIEKAEISYHAFHIMWLYHYTSWNIKGDIIRVYQ